MCLAQGYNFPRIQLPKDTTSQDLSHSAQFVPGSEVIQLFQAQLSMKFIMLINAKMPTILLAF